MRAVALLGLSPELAGIAVNLACGLGAVALFHLRFGNPLACLDAQAGWDQSVGPASWLKPAFFLGGQWRQYGRYGLPNTACALLFLGLPPAVRQRLRWEAQLASARVPTHSIAEHDFGQVGGTPCMAQEYVAGRDVDVVLRRGAMSALPPGSLPS